MRLDELRQAYLDFFKARGHLQLPGAPLVPVNVLGEEDRSLLFSGSGMEQFKPYFTGAAAPPSRRVTTVQKCLRTVDIDSVGDMHHCTFFEMLGNFSFGDYFKAEVIPWTWEFLTNVVGLDPERLCVTVYIDDEEARHVWSEVGLPDDRIIRLGEDKNYWPASVLTDGPDGPCGPCSEIYYRVASLEEMTTDSVLSSADRFRIDDEAGRYVEIWNNVFTQYRRSEGESGKPALTPLPQKNNDTGAGLDRIAYVAQGKRSVFETDIFAPALQRIGRLCGRKYAASSSPQDFAFRVIADHARAMTFCIADGILPSNEGRGYVLRYIMRRAIRYGKMVLGFETPFLHEVAPCIIDQMGHFYTELRERRELVLQTALLEEEQFRRTLDRGLRILEEMLISGAVQETRVLPGADAFRLHDTYGFPLNLTKDLAAERGIEVDLQGFEQAMLRQREQSQRGSNIERAVFDVDSGSTRIPEIERPTEFLGYDTLTSESRALVILHGDEMVAIARPGDDVTVVLDRTPFYAESGGQIGDTGLLTAPAGDVTCALRAVVTDTRRGPCGAILHSVHVLEGELSTGQSVTAEVDAARRLDIMRNHTATHLLQAALRQVLGPHVHQKGSLVAPDRLRFDFTHTRPLSPEELKRVEEQVNREALSDVPVAIHTDVPVDEAKARGAMALFGEKYGERVRMVEVPGFSLELCGGTHLARTSQSGLFKIVGESGVASGVRRIEALTGTAAYEWARVRFEALEEAAALLRVKPTDLPVAIQKVMDQRHELEKQIQRLKSAGPQQQGALEPQTVSGVAVVASAVTDADADAVANLADRTAQQMGSGVVVLGASQEGKVSFVARVTPDLVARGFHAGNLVRDVARVAGGSGGGRPDFARAGARDPGKLSEALAAVPGLVSAQSKG